MRVVLFADGGPRPGEACPPTPWPRAGPTSAAEATPSAAGSSGRLRGAEEARWATDRPRPRWPVTATRPWPPSLTAVKLGIPTAWLAPGRRRERGLHARLADTSLRRNRTRCGRRCVGDATSLRRSYNSGAMKVGIIGLGYVGLPLAVAFAEAGADVIGVDADPREVERLRRSRVGHRGHPLGAAARCRRALHGDHRARAPRRLRRALICVPTPLANQREPDLTYIVDAATPLVARSCARASSWCSSRPRTRAPPASGCCPILEESGLAAGRDFHLAFSPERIDPGRTDHTIRTTPKVVGGLTDACRERAVELYRAICDEVVAVSSPEAAELAKLLENIFRSVNIALVNELAMLCDRMGIDVWEVVDAAATKPFGFMRFDPGPGMGGHCLPVDPFYLAFKAREYDFPTEFIELAGKINQHQPHFCVEKIQRALNDVGKPVKRLAILLLGVAYKAGVGDMRESPALKIARAPARARRRGHLPRPARRRGRPSSTRSVDAGRGARRLRRRLHRHRPRRGGLRRGRRAAPARASTSAASPAGSRPRTSCGSSDGSAVALAPPQAARFDRLTLGLAASPRPPPPATVVVGELLRLARRPASELARRIAAARDARPAVPRDRPSSARLERARRRRTPSRSPSRATTRPRARETVLFNILTGFVGGFALMRLSTAGIRAGWWPTGNVKVGGRHIHHFVPGILLAFARRRRRL